MDLEFTEEQEMLREMVRGVCSSYASLETVREMEDDPIGYPHELWKQLGDARPDRADDPDRVRRLGDDAARRRGRLRGARPRARAVAALRERGDERRRAPAGRVRRRRSAEWLPEIASGDAILTPAWLEPRHGFGPQGVQLTARADGDGFVLDGDEVARAVRQPPRPGSSCSPAPATGDEDVDLFLVDPNAAGVTLTQQLTIGSDTQYQVELAGVRVPRATGIGDAGTGWATWSATMLDGIILLAA